MKFSTRVKVVSILAVFLVMLSSSAWAEPYINISAVLDSTGKQLTVTYSYFLDGKPYDHFRNPPYTSAIMEKMSEEMLMKITFRPAGESQYIVKLSNSPLTAGLTYQRATFTFDQELTEGQYFFPTGGANTGNELKAANDPYSTTDEEWMAFFEELAGPPYNADMDAIGEIMAVFESTGRNTSVWIARDGSFIGNPVPPTPGRGVVAVESFRTGTAVRNEHSALVSVTDSTGHTLPSAVNTSNVDSATIIGLPVFEATVEGSNHTAFMGYETTLNDIAAKGYKVQDLTFLKRRANGAIVAFERIGNPANVGNGQFAVTLMSSPTTELNGDASIASNTMYLFSFGIQDNGNYDWDSTAGTIVDPAAIAASQTQNKSSSGCNAGFGVVGLLLAGIAALKYRKN